MRTRYFGITLLVMVLALTIFWYGRYPIAAIALVSPHFPSASPTDSGYFVNTDQTLALSSVSAVTGDVDGDADPDIILNTFYGGRVFLNQGNLTFEVIDQQLGTLGLDEALAAGDFDNDDDLDVIVGGMIGESNNLYVWLNNGAGTFISTTTPMTATNVGGMVTGDVDGDNDLDVFMGRSFSSNTILWLNNGAGIFADSTQAFGDGRDVAVGDVDEDDDLDVLLTGGTVSLLWFNQGGIQAGTEGVYVEGTQLLPVGDGLGVDLGDIDRDHDLDIAVADGNGAVQLWVNDGSGTFQSAPVPTTTTMNYDVTFSDVDVDGDKDLFVSRSGANQVWLNQGGIQAGSIGTFVLSKQTFEEDFTVGTILTDLDGDTDPDAVTSHFGSPGRVYRNDGLSALQAYYKLRDEIMNQTAQGQHYIDLYNLYREELVQLILAHPELFEDGYTTIMAWTPNIEALVTGKGASAIITQAQVDGLDDFLTDVGAVGSTALQQTIVSERADLPPLDTFVGQTMSQAQVTVLGTEPPLVDHTYLPLLLHTSTPGAFASTPNFSPPSREWGDQNFCLLTCQILGLCGGDQCPTFCRN